MVARRPSATSNVVRRRDGRRRAEPRDPRRSRAPRRTSAALGVAIWLLTGAAGAAEPGSPPPADRDDDEGRRAASPRDEQAQQAAEAEPSPDQAAADEPQPPAPEEPIEVVVTGTRTPESSQRATVRTELVTRQEAERRGATNVGEALQGQLGVQVNPAAYGMIGNPFAIQIQGLDRDRVLVLEDGERVIGGIDGAIDLGQLPLTDVQRIEVVTGPTSSLYGASAIGGVVNIITGPPMLQGPSGRVRLEGRHRWGALAQGTGFYRRDEHWVGLDASAQHAEPITLQGATQAALPAHQQYLLGLRAGTSPLPGVELQLKGRWIHDRSAGEMDETLPGVGTFHILTPDITDRYALHLVDALDLGGGSNLRLTAGQQWTHGESLQDRVDSRADAERTRDGSMRSFELIATIADGPRTWVAGFRSELERFEQRFSRKEVIGGQLVDTGHVEVAPTTLGNGALYAQLAWKIADVLTVLPGVRGELHLHYGPVAAPRLALALRPTRWLMMRAAAGRGFRAPAAREFGFYFDHSVFGYNVLGNRELEPETSWGVNGDVKVMPAEGASLRLGAYANWIDNLIDIEYLRTGPSGVDDYAYQNVAKARTFGLQVDGRYRVSPRLSTEAGWAYTWTRNDTLEQPLPSRPPHTVYAAIRAGLPLQLELYLRHRVVTDAFIEEGLRSPGFQSIDARLSRPVVWRDVVAYVGVLNALGARKDAGRLGDQRPIVGRTLYLGMTATIPPEEAP